MKTYRRLAGSRSGGSSQDTTGAFRNKTVDVF